MANVPGTFYTAETQRKGATPVSPPNADDDPQGPINGATVPPVAKRYTSQAIMIADQNNQLEGYLYFDGTDNWWYNGGTSGTIADYVAFGGGSGATDTDAVHYSVSDGKNATQRNQARVNIGSTSTTPQLIATAGAINDLAITSNNLVFSGASVVLSGIVAGLDGEEVTIININATSLNILTQSTLSSASNRFNGSVIIPQWSIVRIKYRGTNARWLLENIGTLDSRYIRKDVPDTKVGALTMSLASTDSLSLIGTGASTSGGLFRINSGFADSSTTPQFYTIQTTTTLRQQLRNKGDWIHNFQSIAGKEYDIQRLGSSSFTYAHSSVHGVSAWRFYDPLQLGNRSAEAIQALRRDEQRLYYPITVTTAGAINDQLITAGYFNYRFTACTSLTGIQALDIGAKITIQNDNSVSMDIPHESVSSIAANRVKFISGATLTVPAGGKVELMYCTGSRWELISKNF